MGAGCSCSKGNHGDVLDPLDPVPDEQENSRRNLPGELERASEPIQLRISGAKSAYAPSTPPHSPLRPSLTATEDGGFGTHVPAPMRMAQTASNQTEAANHSKCDIAWEVKNAPKDRQRVAFYTSPNTDYFITPSAPVLRQDETENSVKITINHKECYVPKSHTILEACSELNVRIPTLCHHPRLKPVGRCRACVVEVQQSGENVPVFKVSCSAKVQPGMSIMTNTPECKAEQQAAVAELVRQQSMMNLEPTTSSVDVEFHKMIANTQNAFVDESSVAIRRDMSLCVDCGRCVRACKDLQGMNILSHATDPDAPSFIDTQAGLLLDQTDCVSCGQCSLFCPTGAITEVDDADIVLKALQDEVKITVAQFAPSVRVAISEEMGLPPGVVTTGKLVAALKKLGVKHVLDTNFGADLCIMEEGSEFLHRLKHDGVLPMMTSCCPAWVNFVEKLYPGFIPNLSSAKSPQQMLGAIVKTYYAQSIGASPDDIFQISVMPCTAKKGEILRQDMTGAGSTPDVDVVITTRELGRLFRRRAIRFEELDDEKPESPLGFASGAGQLFGASGGVMEAALRTVVELLSGETLPRLEFHDVRGLANIKEAEVVVPGQTLNVAVVHTLAVARTLLDRIEAGTAPQYAFIEVMSCEGGCIGGGGQPRSGDPSVLAKRMGAIYSIDEGAAIRKCHDNPEVTTLYREFLHEPLGIKSHELLHTHYQDYARKDGALRRKRPKRTVKVTYDGLRDSTASNRRKPGEGLLLLFGTTTGTAEEAAMTIGARCRVKGFSSCTMRISQYEPPDLRKEGVVIFVLATAGDGEVTDDAMQMYSYLGENHSHNMLKGLRYMVFGLGNREYEQFCAAGRDFVARLGKLGARQLHPLGQGDENDDEHYQAALDPWLETAMATIPHEFHQSAVKLPYRVVPVEAKPLTNVMTEGFHGATVLTNQQLTDPDGDLEIRFLELNVAGMETPYQVGDCLAIQLSNPKEATEQFIYAMGLDSADVISIHEVSEDTMPLALPPHLTVGQLFLHFLDIFARPNRPFFQKLSQYVRNEREKRAVARIGDIKAGAQQFRSYYDSGATFVDAFRDFPSAKPPLGALIDMVHMIKPRRYVIASAPPQGTEVAQLVVVVDHFETPRGWKVGQCTRYIKNLGEGELVPVRVMRGRLLPPKDASAPLLLVAGGGGIAAFRAILQWRKHLFERFGTRLGPAILFYDCSDGENDFLFREDWDDFLECHVLSELHLIAGTGKNSPSLGQVLMDPVHQQRIWEYFGGTSKGICMYSGPSSEGCKELEDAILSCLVSNGMSCQAARISLKKMKLNKRLLVELHGAVHGFDTNISDTSSSLTGSILSV